MDPYIGEELTTQQTLPKVKSGTTNKSVKSRRLQKIQECEKQIEELELDLKAVQDAMDDILIELTESQAALDSEQLASAAKDKEIEELRAKIQYYEMDSQTKNALLSESDGNVATVNCRISSRVENRILELERAMISNDRFWPASKYPRPTESGKNKNMQANNHEEHTVHLEVSDSEQEEIRIPQLHGDNKQDNQLVAEANVDQLKDMRQLLDFYKSNCAGVSQKVNNLMVSLKGKDQQLKDQEAIIMVLRSEVGASQKKEDRVHVA